MRDEIALERDRNGVLFVDGTVAESVIVPAGQGDSVRVTLVDRRVALVQSFSVQSLPPGVSCVTTGTWEGESGKIEVEVLLTGLADVHQTVTLTVPRGATEEEIRHRALEVSSGDLWEIDTLLTGSVAASVVPQQGDETRGPR